MIEQMVYDDRLNSELPKVYDEVVKSSCLSINAGISSLSVLNKNDERNTDVFYCQRVEEQFV